MAIHLGCLSPVTSCNQPGRRLENMPCPGTFPPLPAGDARPAAPIRSCSRWGLACHPRYRGCGALLPHRFALTCRQGPRKGRAYRRFDFCATFPGVAPARRYLAPYFRGARTFLTAFRQRGHPAIWRRSDRPGARPCQTRPATGRKGQAVRPAGKLHRPTPTGLYGVLNHIFMPPIVCKISLGVGFALCLMLAKSATREIHYPLWR